jgi:hypothetical protein
VWNEAIREAITRMGPTQAAALVMQEQATAEATRVASLRARGIAADPRPAIEMAEAQQVIAFLTKDGVTGALRPLADTALAGLTAASESASLTGEGVEGTARVARHHQCWTGKDIHAMEDLVYKLHQGATIAEAGTVFLGASGALLGAFASGITAIVFGIGEFHFSRVLIQMQSNQC